MHLEKKREQEIAARRGSSTRTVIQLAWLALSIAIAYFVIEYLVAEEIISYGRLRSQLQLPRLSDGVLRAGMIAILVFISQFLLFIGFFLADPLGRQKSGKPSLYSRQKDVYDDTFRGH